MCWLVSVIESAYGFIACTLFLYIFVVILDAIFIIDPAANTIFIDNFWSTFGWKFECENKKKVNQNQPSAELILSKNPIHFQLCSISHCHFCVKVIQNKHHILNERGILYVDYVSR